MRHEMLTQRALFCHRANTKRGTLTQHFVTHVVPPLDKGCNKQFEISTAILRSDNSLWVCRQTETNGQISSPYYLGDLVMDNRSTDNAITMGS